MDLPITGSLRRSVGFRRLVSFLVVVSFLGLQLQPLALAAETPSAPKAATTPAPSDEERLYKALLKIEQKLGKLVEKLSAHQDASLEDGEVKELHKDLKTLDARAIQTFDAIEQNLKAKGLPPAILSRHSAAVAAYRADFQTLDALLTALAAAPTDQDRKLKAEQAKKHLETKQKKRPHQPFDPSKLPQRPHGFKAHAPRLSEAAFTELQRPVQLAFNGSLSALQTVLSATDLPTAADLAEAPEVQFTPELRQIATLLENDPVQLYEFVRNTFTYEPYYGSVKGSQAALFLQAGNDFDQASVLIALYRQAGIPARYVYGTVEIPIEKAMKWLGGITNPKVVGEALVSNGIPATLIYVGGVPSAVRLEHVWTEVYLPYENYRGKINDPSAKKSWIPLDPSFKLHDPNPNALDLAAAQGFDADSYFTNYLQTVKPRTPAENYLKDSIDYVAANLPGQLFYDLLSSGPIGEQVLGLLPNTLAYPVKAPGGRFSTVPDSYRHRVTVEMGLASASSPDIRYVAPWTNLLHKRFTLSYEPASAADAQTIAAYGDLYSTPPYLISVKPILKVEGQIVAEGAAVPMAADLAFRMTFSGVNGDYQGDVNNLITAGAIYAIALDSGYTTDRIMYERGNKWLAAVTQAQVGEPIVGEFLNLLAVTYLQELDTARKLTARTMKLLDTNRTAEVMVGVDLGIAYAFGIPRITTINGVLIDVDRDTGTVLSLDGDHTKTRRFQILDGMTSSALEHAVFEGVLSDPTLQVEAVSAVKALQVAATQGILIHRIDASNLQAKLALLQIDSDIKTDIQNAVNAGLVATVSERPVQINSWTGVGYILLDPTTGTGAYRISGGIGGGNLTMLIGVLLNMIASGLISEAKAQEIFANSRQRAWQPHPVPGADEVRPFRLPDDPRGRHDGVDLAAPLWAPVQATAPGRVVAVNENSETLGKVVFIDHGSGIKTVYGHLCEVATGILAGTTVSVQQGDVIGRLGNTGYVESMQFGGGPLPETYPRCDPTGQANAGAHLHYEIRVNNQPVNPAIFTFRDLQ